MHLNKTLLLAFVLLFTSFIQAQPRMLKKVMELAMPKNAEDENSGIKGASVCWNPVSKKYYAAFSGSKNFPLGVFDAAGKLISDTSLTAMQDVKGLWYDPSAKKICGNAANDAGWFSYTLNNKGIPTSVKNELTGMHQPDENSTGAFDTASSSVYFLDKGKLIFYSFAKGLFIKKTPIHWGQPKVSGPGEFENEDNENTDYNHTTVVFTGIPDAQSGLLNVKRNRIELYDNTDGYLQQILLLPEDDFTGSRSFNFAYANGIYWLFDIYKRIWLGFN